MHIVREKVKEKLLQTRKFPLTLIIAPIGYGKTTTIQTVARMDEVKVEWYDQHMAPWQPKEEYTESTWVVLDDYGDVLQDAVYADQLMRVIKRDIKNLHIICITKCMPSLPIAELKIKNLCQMIELEDLRFTAREIKEYLEWHQIYLQDTDRQALEYYTQGWPAAIYLFKEHHKHHQHLDYKQSVYRLLEDSIYSRYTKKQKEILLFLGCVECFKYDELEWGDDTPDVREDLVKILSESVFMNYDMNTQEYQLMPLFQDFLKHKLKNVDLHTYRYIYKYVGKWYLMKRAWNTGLEYLLQAGQWEEVLMWLEGKDCGPQLHIGAELAGELLGKLPSEALYNHSLAHLRLIYQRVRGMSPKAAGEWLDSLQQSYEERLADDNEQKYKVIGELWAIRGISVCQDMQSVNECFQRVREYLPEGSQVISGVDLISTERLHLSYFYHTKAGQYKEQVHNLMGKLRYYRGYEKSYSVELEYLLCAERYMYTGKWEQATSYASKAYYKGEMIGSAKIKLCAQLILARIALGQGEILACEKMIQTIQQCTEYGADAKVNLIKNVGLSYLYGCTGQPVAELQLGDLKQLLDNTSYLHQCMSLSIAEARHLLQGQEWIKLEIMVDIMREDWADSDKVFAQIYYYMFEAVVAAHNQSWDKAALALQSAIEIGCQDALILPFVEYSKELAPIWEYLQLDDQLRGYVQKLRSVEMLKYEKGHNEKKARKTEWGLTRREWEIADLIKQGLTNKEIAERLFVANITVAKTTSNIYKKMGVTGRVEMVGLL